MTMTIRSCSDVDELAAAYALGALEREQLREIGRHLETCPNTHRTLREFIAVAGVVPESLEPMDPRPETLARVLATVSRTPRAGVATARPRTAPATAAARQRGEWWPLRAAVAVSLALVLAVTGLTVWNLQLQAQLRERDAALAAASDVIANGRAAYRVEGTAGTGYLVESQTGDASLVVTDVAELRADELYAMWLVSAAGHAPAGTFAPAPDEEIVVAALEQPVANYTALIVTVETEQGERPTTDTVMSAELDS